MKRGYTLRQNLSDLTTRKWVTGNREKAHLVNRARSLVMRMLTPVK